MIIDTLVVELGLDASKFSKGEKDAIDALRRLEQEGRTRGNAVESQARRMTDVLGSFRREAISALGVFLGGRGIKEFVGYVTTLDASVGRLSKTLDQTPEEVSAWQGAIEQVGGTAQSASAALAGVSREINTFAITGNSSMLGVLQNLGVGLYNANGKLKTSAELFLDIADTVKGMRAGEAAAKLAMIPGMNEDMINLLIKGRVEVGKYLQTARDAGGTTKESAAAAEEYQRALANLDRSATSLGRTLTTMLAPSVTAVFKAITFGLNSLRDTPEQRAEREKKMTEERGGLTFSESTRKQFGEPPKWLYQFNFGKGANANKGTGEERTAGGTRGDRNNNPGNMEYGEFARRHGATGTDGRFAIFPDKETGEKANEALLGSDAYRGLTLQQIQRKWVGNVDENYLAHMTRATGLARDAVPDLQKPELRRRLMAGMARGEGTTFSGNVASNVASGRAGDAVSADAAVASRSRVGDVAGIVRSLGAGAAAASAPKPSSFPASPVAPVSNIQIGAIHVDARGNDANGIAKNVRTALEMQMDAAAVNYSLR